jgi:hypothetical protein
MLKACKRVKISEKHLKDLEDRVRAISLQRHSNVQAKASSKASEIAFPDYAGDESIPRGDLPSDDYQILMEHDRVLHMIEEQNKRNEAIKKKKHTKSVLDRQLEELNNRKEAERKEAERYGDELFRQSQEYQKELIRIKQTTMNKNKKDKEELEADLAKVQQQRQRAEEAKQRAEAKELARIKAELEAEKQRKRENMLAQQAYVNKVRAENEAQKRERAAQQKLIREEDKKRDEMYYQKLEAEERNRLAHLEALKARSSSSQAKFVEATRERDEAEREMERMIAMHQEQQYQAECKKHEDQIARRKQDTKDMHASLSRQIARKEEEAREEREAFMEAARQAKLDAEKARQYEEEQKQLQRQIAQQYKQALDEQVKAKSGEVIETKMNSTERVLNASKFRAIYAEPGVAEIVKLNLKPRPQQVLQAQKEKQRELRLAAFKKKC